MCENSRKRITKYTDLARALGPEQYTNMPKAEKKKTKVEAAEQTVER